MTHPLAYYLDAESVELKYIVTYSRMNLINKRGKGKLENSLISWFIYFWHSQILRDTMRLKRVYLDIQFHYYASFRKLIILI